MRYSVTAAWATCCMLRPSLLARLRRASDCSSLSRSVIAMARWYGSDTTLESRADATASAQLRQEDLYMCTVDRALATAGRCERAEGASGAPIQEAQGS